MVNASNGNTSPLAPSAQARVGVLALQGDFAEHIHMLDLIGIDAVEVRKVEQLSEIDGLIIPGGESTTIVKLLTRFGFVEELRLRVESGMALWGTCAGMIVIARDLADAYPTPLGLLDIGVARNYFGRQVDSFEAEINIEGVAGDPVRAVFIRAPVVLDTGDGVEIIASVSVPAGSTGQSVPSGSTGQGVPAGSTGQGGPSGDRRQAVAVRKGRVMATSFHPELTTDTRLHTLFVQLAQEAAMDGSSDSIKSDATRRSTTEEISSTV